MSQLTILWIATILKILFVLAVVVGAFAPMLIWAERRQSAFIQDRIGPNRAHIKLSKDLLGLVDGLRMPMQFGAYAALAGSGASALVLVVMAATSTTSILGLTPMLFWLAIPALLVLSVALRVGHAIHNLIVKSEGRVNAAGLLHPVADALKFFMKEDFVPPHADKLLHALSPIISLVPALVAFAVIPFAEPLYLDYWDTVLPPMAERGPHGIPMQIADLNVGILFLFAVGSTGVIGAAIGGYASDNKYSLMGGLRAASQMVSYEVALGLTLVPAFMLYGTLRLGEMGQWQNDHTWGIVYPPMWLAFVLYVTSAIAESKRVPFDLPEGESELVGGYLTEYSGMKFGMFFFSEFVEVVALAALAAIFFFGGWDVPFLHSFGFDLPGTWEYTLYGTDFVVRDHIYLQHWFVVALEVVVFIAKIVVLIFFQLLVRWTLPRFRYDQVMKLCWKGILPLSLANIFFTALFIMLFLE